MTVTFGEKTGKKTKIYIDGEFIGSLYPKDIYDHNLENDGGISEKDTERIVNEILIPRAKRYVMNLLVKSDKTETELRRKLHQAGYGETVADHAIEYVKGYHYIDELRTAESYIRTKMDFSSEKEIRYKLTEKGIDDETIDLAYDQILESMMPGGDSDDFLDSDFCNVLNADRDKALNGSQSADTMNECRGVDMAYIENTELKAAENFVRKKLGSKFSSYINSDADEMQDDEDAGEISYEEKQKLMAAAFRKGFRQESIRQALERLKSIDM